MYRKFTLTLLLACLTSMSVLAQNTQFQRVIGRSGNDNSYAIEPTPDGGYIMVGYTDSLGKDVLLTKVNGLGQLQWNKSYDFYGTDDIGWGITVTSDSGFVIAGQTKSAVNGTNDALLFKTKKDGSVDWTLTFSDTFNSDAYDVIQGRNGEFYVAGYTQTDTMGDNMFVSRVTSTGTISWYRTYGTEFNEEAYALAQDLQGNIVVVGITNSDSITAGSKSGNPGDVDLVVGKIKSIGGSMIWMYNYGTMQDDIAWDVAISQTQYAIVGWSGGVSSGGNDNDVILATVDTAGKVTNATSFGTFGDDRGFKLDVIPGGYIIGGYTDPSGGDRSVMTLKVGSNMLLTDYSTVGSISGKDGHWPTDVAISQDGGIVTFSTTDSYRPGQGNDLYLIRSNSKLVNACNSQFEIIGQGSASFDKDTLTYQSTGIAIARPTAKTTTLKVKDSTLCCKLEARVIGDSIATCGPVGASIGRAAISGYSYKWTDLNSSWTSTAANPFVKPTSTTTYKLVVTSSDNACSPDSATVKVIVHSLLTGDFVTDSFFCENDSVTISTRNDLSTYSWVGKYISGNTSSLKVKKADTIVLTVTDKNGCIYKDTSRVTMNMLPVFSLGKDTSICVNLSITLKGPDNMASYNWNNGEGSNQTFETNSEQVHELKVVDSFGCAYSDKISILTNPYSEFSLGPDTAFCEGTTWYILGPGALNGYIWNDTASKLQNLPVKQPGTYHLTAFNSFGCPFSDTVTLTERPAPEFTLTDDVNICDGDTRILRGPAGYDSYQWHDLSELDSFEATGAGTFWLTVRDEYNCPFTDSVTLIIRAKPVVDLGADTSINDGDTIILNAGAGFSSYLWSTSETTQTIKVFEDDTYTVTVTNEFGCAGSDSRKVTVILGVNNLFLQGVKVYPVPATDYVMLELGDIPGGEITIEMVDLSGKILYSTKASSGNEAMQIDLSGVTPGVYMIRLYNSQGSGALRVVVER